MAQINALAFVVWGQCLVDHKTKPAGKTVGLIWKGGGGGVGGGGGASTSSTCIQMSWGNGETKKKKKSTKICQHSACPDLSQSGCYSKVKVLRWRIIIFVCFGWKGNWKATLSSDALNARNWNTRENSCALLPEEDLEMSQVLQPHPSVSILHR